MNSSIRITTLNKDSKLEVSLDKPALRPKKNICEFKTADWRFNWTFKTKRAHVSSVNILTDQNDLFNSFLEFYTRWIFNLDTLFIDNGEIFCRFKYGFYLFPYITEFPYLFLQYFFWKFFHARIYERWQLHITRRHVRRSLRPLGRMKYFTFTVLR
ncbi:MAG: hypothetical protein JXK07_16090 [Spirochaetes bacterium]|nr:hypothetical protein [Spirochaetota bacterium]MBN2771998.1 hypothetical protein [Spirochaetota bacterium]